MGRCIIKRIRKGYNYINLPRFRQFYLTFPILVTVWQELSLVDKVVLLAYLTGKIEFQISGAVRHQLNYVL